MVNPAKLGKIKMSKRQISEHAHVAKLIRAELKKNGVPAKVTSSTYSMGNSVTVNLSGDPLPSVVRNVSKFADTFQAGDFNGMEDIYEYRKNVEGPTVKYVHVQVRYSDELREAAKQYVIERFGDDMPEHTVNDYARRIMNGTKECDFWQQRKPRVTAS